MSKWISIKDEMPLRYQTVLVSCPKEEGLRVRICQFNNWEGAEKLGITHWMPLPFVPEEE